VFFQASFQSLDRTARDWSNQCQYTVSLCVRLPALEDLAHSFLPSSNRSAHQTPGACRDSSAPNVLKNVGARSSMMFDRPAGDRSGLNRLGKSERQRLANAFVAILLVTPERQCFERRGPNSGPTWECNSLCRNLFRVACQVVSAQPLTAKMKPRVCLPPDSDFIEACPEPPRCFDRPNRFIARITLHAGVAA